MVRMLVLLGILTSKHIRTQCACVHMSVDAIHKTTAQVLPNEAHDKQNVALNC